MPDDLIRKALASPAGDDPLVFVMSDGTVDRVGDIIEAKGWNLKNFANNPIALFSHDHKFIIGHWTNVKVQGQQLIGRLNLLQKGISDRLDEVITAVEAGILRAVSVGFTADPEDVEPLKSGGLRYKAAELLECSLVSVPANPNALQMAKALNLSDDVQALIFEEEEKPADPEIPTEPTEPAATGKKAATVVRLGEQPATGPFVIRRIHPAK